MVSFHHWSIFPSCTTSITNNRFIQYATSSTTTPLHFHTRRHHFHGVIHSSLCFVKYILAFLLGFCLLMSLTQYYNTDLYFNRCNHIIRCSTLHVSSSSFLNLGSPFFASVAAMESPRIPQRKTEEDFTTGNHTTTSFLSPTVASSDQDHLKTNYWNQVSHFSGLTSSSHHTRAPFAYNDIVFQSSSFTPLLQTLFSETAVAMEKKYKNDRILSFYSREGSSNLGKSLQTWSEPIIVSMDEFVQEELKENAQRYFPQYPSSTFIFGLDMNINQTLFESEKNYAQIHVRMDIVSYVTGYVAASTSSTQHICFLMAANDLKNHLVLNAWTLGAQKSKPSVKIHFAHLNNHGVNEETIKGVLKLFKHWNCDVVSGSVHSSHLYKYAQEMGIKSTGFAYDWRSLLGYDEILVSSTRTWTHLLEAAFEEKFTAGELRTLRHISDPIAEYANYVSSGTGLSAHLSDFSPLVTDSIQAAATNIYTSLLDETEQIWCGPLISSDSVQRIPTGQCRTFNQLINNYQMEEWNGLKGTHNLGLFENPAVACRSGMFFLYDIDRNLLTCHLCREGHYASQPMENYCATCPENTYSIAGSAECIQCANGTSSSAGSLSCAAPFPYYWIVVGAASLFALALLISVPSIYGIYYFKRHPALKNAPRKGECTLIAMNIEQVLHLYDAFEYDMNNCQIILDKLLEKRLKTHSGYLSTYSKKEGYLLAFEKYSDALAFACSMQLDMLKQDWPDTITNSTVCPTVLSEDGDYLMRGPRLKMGVLTATPLYSFSRLSLKMAYFGPAVVLVKYLMDAACGGRILSTVRCLDLMQYDLDTSREIRIKYKMQHRMKFVGSKKAIRLVEFAPAELEEREFPPLGNISGGFLYKTEEDKLLEEFFDIENDDTLSSIAGRDHIIKSVQSFILPDKLSSDDEEEANHLQVRKTSHVTQHPLQATTQQHHQHNFHPISIQQPTSTLPQSPFVQQPTNTLPHAQYQQQLTPLQIAPRSQVPIATSPANYQTNPGPASNLRAQPMPGPISNTQTQHMPHRTSHAQTQSMAGPTSNIQIHHMSNGFPSQPQPQLRHQIQKTSVPQNPLQQSAAPSVPSDKKICNGDCVYFGNRKNQVLKLEGNRVTLAPFSTSGLKHIFQIGKRKTKVSSVLPPNINNFELVSIKSLISSCYLEWNEDGYLDCQAQEENSSSPLQSFQIIKKKQNSSFEVRGGDVVFIKSPWNGKYISCSGDSLVLEAMFDPSEDEEFIIHFVRGSSANS